MQNLHDFMHMRWRGSNSRDMEALNAVAEVLCLEAARKKHGLGYAGAPKPVWRKAELNAKLRHRRLRDESRHLEFESWAALGPADPADPAHFQKHP